MDLASYVMISLKNASEMITFAYDAPFARAVVFGVPIGGMFSSFNTSLC